MSPMTRGWSWAKVGVTAQGTAASPIVLTGQEKTPGYWNGLQLWDSNSVNNILDYVTIEYAGGGGFPSANLAVINTMEFPRIQVQHCTIGHSAGWGVLVDQHATVNGDMATVNTFADNASGDVYVW